MAGQIFTYVSHKDGVADDTALELAAAAKKIIPDPQCHIHFWFNRLAGSTDLP